MKTQDLFAVGTMVFVFGSSVAFGGTVAAGVTSGLISSLGVGVLVLKLKDSKPGLWRLLLKHTLVSDLLLSGFFVVILPVSTVTGIIGASSAALFTSVALCYVKKLSCSES